jgi:hypothetical protein
MDGSARRTALASCLVAFASMGVAQSARAQQPTRPAGDVAAAQALFDDAKRLMDAKRFAEACPKLAESQRLDPGGGTTVLLAICHEGEGKLASAWADYNEALTEARRDRRSDRERVAAAKIEELAPKLPRIEITPTGNEPGLQIKRDGVLVGRAQWGTAVPIDPGEYVFEASAPGKLTWRGSAKIVPEPKTFNIMIPVLSDAPAAAAPPPPPAGAAASRAPSPEENRAETERSAPATSSDRWLVTGVLGGAGLVVAGVGGIVGLSAMSSWNSVKNDCPGGRCPTGALVDDGNGVRGRADVATALVLVGGAVVATAVILNLAWPEPAGKSALRAAPYAARDGGGFMLGGTL